MHVALVSAYILTKNHLNVPKIFRFNQHHNQRQLFHIKLESIFLEKVDGLTSIDDH